MNTLFGNANEQLAGSEKEKDVLGGRSLLPTSVYDGTLEVAYVTQSTGGAKAFNLVVDVKGKKIRDTIYVTSKTGAVTFEKDGKKYPLPGYSLINALCKLTIGKEIPQLTFEKKLVKVYDFDLKKEVAKEMDVAVELSGEAVKLGIAYLRENKNVKDQANNYVPTNELRDSNVIERVFHPKTGQTISEYDAQTPSEFLGLWLKEFDGKIRDKSKVIAGAPPAATATAGAPAGATAGKSSLFGG